MVDRKKAIESFAQRLRAKGGTVDGFEVGDPVQKDRLERTIALADFAPPPPLLGFWREADGAALMWNARDDHGELSGGLHILDCRAALLRVGSDEDSEPLQGILWTGDEDDDVLKLFKRMAIFESVPGRNDYLTFLIDNPDELYFVADNKPKRIHSTLADTLNVLVTHVGADGLRGHLTNTNWRERVRDDPVLARVRAL